MPLVELNVPAFTDMKDYQRVLASLREPLLMEEIAQNSVQMDADRMRAALDAGVFDAAPFIAAIESDPASLEMFQNAWSGRCQSMLAVMQSIETHKEIDGARGGRFEMSLTLPDEVDNVIDAFVAHTIEQVKHWQRHKGSPTLDTPIGQVTTQLSHLACMTDKPDALRQLMATTDTASTCFANYRTLANGKMSKNNGFGWPTTVTPLFTALQLSSPKCVALLLQKSDANPVLCTMGQSRFPMGLLHCLGQLQLRGSTECTAMVMQHLIERAEPSDENIRSSIVEVLVNVMDTTVPWSNDHCLVAAGHAGWLDLQPSPMLINALRHDWPAVIEHFKTTMPWTTIAEIGSSSECPADRAMTNGNVGSYKALVQMAKNEGDMAKASVLAHFVEGNALMAPMDDRLILSKGGVELLPKLLEIGLNPNVTTLGGSSTLLACAKKSGTEAAGILSSFVARTLAHEMIAELELSEKTNHVPR